MNPNRTSAPESMLASTGRRIAVSESFIGENLSRKVNRPDSISRNGTSRGRVPDRCCQYVEKERGKSTCARPVRVTSRGPKIYRSQDGPQGARKTSQFRFGTWGRTRTLQDSWRAGRMAKAPVL